VGAGDAAAVLAEVEIGHRAGMRAELAHLAALHDESALAGGGGDGAGRAMRREMLEPLALLVGKLGRCSVAGDAQQATVVAAAHNPSPAGSPTSASTAPPCSDRQLVFRRR
jgi:hypothetical protein